MLSRLAALGGLTAAVGALAAAPIPGLYHSGVGDNGSPLAGGAVDPHWRLVASPNAGATGSAAFVVRDGYPIPPWLGNGPTSKWIAPKADQSDGNAPGNYVYRQAFDLAGFDSATAVVTGRWSSDNAGIEVRLNGQPTGITFDGNFGAFSPPFTLRDTFLPGTNTIEFVVNNAGDGVNPTGFRAELAGSAEATPPGTPPSIRTEPENVTAAPQDLVTFRVVAAGSPPLRHQWRLDGSPLSEATASVLTIPSVTAAWVGGYDVVVRNDFGAVTSRVAQLILQVPSPAERAYEPLGPSSRRTGVALTEILFHPAPDAGGRRPAFVELYNSNPFFEDLGGWRLDGDFGFTFPPNTILPGNAFLVVAPVPADVRAIHGITNVIGGFPFRSGAGAGAVRLHKRSGAVVLEVEYAESPAWPAAAFGPGHSLVLARPSYGEGDPRAWAASALIGGSPGGPDPVPAGPLESVRLNELLAHPTPGPPGFVELHNSGVGPVNIGGCVLKDGATEAAFRIPAGTTLGVGGFASFGSPDFDLAATGGLLLLLSPDEMRVLDALRFGGQARNTALGRTPDGTPEWRTLDHPTPEAPNPGPAASPVVIHELHYHPPDDNDDAEFIELFNPGPTALALDGWRLTDGVQFEFPAGATIPGGGFAVIVRQREDFLVRHPALDPARVFGNYAGSLADRGERVALSRPELEIVPTPGGTLTNRFFVEVDDVTYADGGQWGHWADGGGSSLELSDPRADRRLGPNWADSDETARAPWTTIATTGVLTLAHPGVPQADQLQIMLLGAGEAIVDEVAVLVGGANRVANGTFDGGTAGWHFQGTHRLSRLESGGGFGGGAGLRLIASDRGDHVANRVRTVLSSSIPAGATATLRARVRWLRGHPEILLRLRNGALEASGRIDWPAFTGTPGEPNSRRLANAPPAITEVRHQPVLPAANQPVRVTARVADPDGIRRVILRYRVDPATATEGLPMQDDGAGPDAMGGDGVFTGQLPGQPGGALVAFRVVAQDASTAGGLSGALSLFPAGATDRECLVRFGETLVPGAFGNYRFWLTRSAHDRWAAREKMSNEDVMATFVYGSHRVIYEAGAHYSGSSYTAPIYDSPTGALCGYDLTFPVDDPLLGDDRLTLDWPIRDSTDQREQLMFWFLDQLDLPNLYRRYVHLFVNGVRRGTIYDDVQQPGSDTIREWFPEDAEGSLWKTDCWNEFDNAGNRVDPCILNTLQRFPSTGPLKPARYRWNWRPRAVRGSANDFTDLFTLVGTMNATTNYAAAVEALVDVDHWMRTFAMNDLASYWDAFGNPNAKNTFLYKPRHDAWKLMCWDFDVGLGVFNDPPNAPLFEVNDPTLTRMYRTPAFVRRYWATLEDALERFFRTGAGSPVDLLLDAKYAAFRAQGVALASPAAIKSWMGQRRSFLQTQLNTVRAPFAITTHAGAAFSTNREPLALTGTAPVRVRFLRVNGTQRTVTWTSVSNWTVVVPLQPGLNRLHVEGFDRLDSPLDGASDDLVVDFTGPQSEPTPVRINEWLASNRSGLADPADGAFDDWFELFNAGETPVDLAGFTLTDDLNRPDRFPIPPGFVIGPGAFLVVWADGEPEQTRTGTALHVNFQLARDGSVLALFDPLGRVVDALRFGAQQPDVSEGRWGDGAPGDFFPFSTPTPGVANPPPDAGAWAPRLMATVDVATGILELAWDTTPGRRYAVEYRERWDPGSGWRPLGEALTATGERTTVQDRPPAGAAERYYRVRLLRSP